VLLIVLSVVAACPVVLFIVLLVVACLTVVLSVVAACPIVLFIVLLVVACLTVVLSVVAACPAGLFIVLLVEACPSVVLVSMRVQWKRVCLLPLQRDLCRGVFPRFEPLVLGVCIDVIICLMSFVTLPMYQDSYHRCRSVVTTITLPM